MTPFEGSEPGLVLVTLRLVLSPGRRREILHTLRSVTGPTRVKPGCMGCWLYRDVEDENAVTLIEEWRAQADLDRHLRSDEYRRVLAAMDCAVEPPELKVYSIAHTAGFEAVEAARG